MEKMAEEESKELPDECWAMIFNHIDHESDQESVTLVCKRLLSITNSLRVSLRVLGPSITILSRLLQRFSCLKKIQLCSSRGDLNAAVLAIAQSGLELEELDLSYNGRLQTVCLEELGSKMKSIKVLNCSSCLADADLVRIADSFLQLEELQIGVPFFPHDKGRQDSICVTDEGIEYLSSKLKRLRKIDLSHNLYISDKSRVFLSSNCAFLEHVTVSYCRRVTENGISFLINNSRHLNFLLLCAHFKIRSFEAKGSINFLMNLQSLKFTDVVISNEFLYSIVKARIPLTDLTLSQCESYTFTGISRLVKYSCQTLKFLNLQGAEFLTNKHIWLLSPFLCNLTTIKLQNCPKLSDSGFVIFTQRCPLLRHLEMRDTSVGRKKYTYNGLKKNCAIKYLNLSANSYLSPAGLNRLLKICLKVEKIKLSTCFQHNEELDVADVLECSKGLVNLVLMGCHRLKVSEEGMELSMLETVFAKYSGINDEMLAMLGRICPRLVHLDLTCCNMTAKGVKEVVKSCKRLRYLSLSGCENVDISIIDWIVTNSPSLRKFLSPSHTYPDEENQKRLLQLGCRVNKGVYYEPDQYYY